MITIDEFVGEKHWEISQEFGPTEFARNNPVYYSYGQAYCMPRGTHPGLDIGVPIGTKLYSPIAGRVIIAGGNPYFQDETCKGAPQTGQLKIEMANRTHVIIGHMRSIAVSLGDQVSERQYIGLSGTDNGPHAHVEVRMPDNACIGGRRCIDPRGSVFVTQPRLFRIEVPLLSVRDQPSVTAASPGDYQIGEIAPCNQVILAEEVKPDEPAWGQIADGRFVGKWVYLGFTQEVRPASADGVRYFVVRSHFRNVRMEPDTTSPIIGSYERGAILPIMEVATLNGEHWGMFAYGPYKNRWSYLGSQESSLELR